MLPQGIDIGDGFRRSPFLGPDALIGGVGEFNIRAVEPDTSTMPKHLQSDDRRRQYGVGSLNPVAVTSFPQARSGVTGLTPHFALNADPQNAIGQLNCAQSMIAGLPRDSQKSYRAEWAPRIEFPGKMGAFSMD